MIHPPQVRPEEPIAVTPHDGICGGESQQWLSYPTNPHVRFDERGRETERCRMAQATAPVLDSTPNEVVKNIGRGQAALKAVDRIPQARAGLRDVLFEILGRLGHFETLLVKTP